MQNSLLSSPSKRPLAMLAPIPEDHHEDQKWPGHQKVLYPAFIAFILLPFLWAQYALVGPNSVGTPPQTVEMNFGGEKTSQRKLAEKVQRECNQVGDAEVPKLVTVYEWRSTKPQPREAITIITQLSIDRLTMLENQCRTWPDPISAAVYIPMFHNSSGGMPIVPTYRNTTLEDAIRGMDAFFQFMETTSKCALHMQLVGQFLDPLEPEQYPINSLRNIAVDMSETDLILLLDVDFVATAMLGLPKQGYRDPAVYNQMVDLCNERKALVLPAFEITNRKQNLLMAQNFARHMVIAGKDTIRQHYLSGRIDAFNGQDAPWGHGPTNTSKWIMLDKPITYKIQYEPRYEPFVILSQREAPWFDERFVGYGGNKIAYINQLAGLGFTFHVHPFGFTIHVPHVRTKAANIFLVQKRAGESKMEELRANIEDQVSNGSFVPLTVFCEDPGRRRKLDYVVKL